MICSVWHFSGEVGYGYEERRLFENWKAPTLKEARLRWALRLVYLAFEEGDHFSGTTCGSAVPLLTRFAQCGTTPSAARTNDTISQLNVEHRDGEISPA